MERIFHPDSYGYRPGRSALDAVGTARKRCWKFDWVIDVDIKSFFDSIPWHLIEKAVAHHTKLSWIRLYVKRWLQAPAEKEDGILVERTAEPLRVQWFHRDSQIWFCTMHSIAGCSGPSLVCVSKDTLTMR